jgi:hypothetical protein
MFSLDPDLSNYTPQRARAFYQELLGRVAALPGVQAVSLDRFGLLGRSFGIAQMAMRVEGYEPQGDEASGGLLATILAKAIRLAGGSAGVGRISKSSGSSKTRSTTTSAKSPCAPFICPTRRPPTA